MLTNVHMLGSQRSAKHPADTSPLTGLGCPGLLSKDSLCKQSLLLLKSSASDPSSPEGKRDMEERCRSGWRELETSERKRERELERENEREGKRLGGGEGRGN